MKTILLSILWLIFFDITSSAQAIKITAEVVPMKLERISKSLIELAAQQQYVPHAERMEVDNPSLEKQQLLINPHPLPDGPDPALQKTYNTTRDITVNLLSVWSGLTDNIDPSDNNITVGPNHVMQMINLTYIRIWDKAGNILVPQVTVESVTGMNDIGDPNSLYDPIADRFVFTVIPTGSNKLVIAASQTNDPAGAYYVYSFPTSNGFPDYPKIGMWGNAYFITTNSNSPTVFALNRDSILSGAALPSAQKFTTINFPSFYIQDVAPVTFTGSELPEAAGDAIMIRPHDDAWENDADSDYLEIYKTHVDWDNIANSVMSGPFILNTAPYSSDLCGYDALSTCIPQPNTNAKLETMSSVILDKAQYRRFSNFETIVCSTTSDADGNDQAGPRWYELRKDDGMPDWYIYQQGTYGPPDTNSRWMSSISVNSKGAIALGYNISSKTVYPGARVTGRAWCDSLNTMSAVETEVLHGTHKNGSYRYGDFNSMVTDPVDDSFWFTAMYDTSNNWITGVSHFVLTDNCLPLTTYHQSSVTGNFAVKPNPGSGLVEISFMSGAKEDAKLAVFDRTGRQMQNKIISANAGINKTTLSVESLTDGVYILKLQTKQGTLQQKMVIAH
ncbi:MAG: T9SS type A sorting domain-containing protein [Chitinophagales bacterium]